MRLERSGLITMTLVLSLLFTGAGFYTHYLVTTEEAQNLKRVLDEELSDKVNMVNESIALGRDEVEYFAQLPSTLGIVRALNNQQVDPKTKISLLDWKAILASNFKAYMQEHKHILQMRFVLTDPNHSELLKVQLEGKNIVRVSDSQLQSKAGRDYIHRTMELQKGDTFVSEIGLNREFGKLQQPYQPTYRISQLVFGPDDVAQGMIIINYDAKPLIDSLQSDLPNNLTLIGVGAQEQFFIHPKDNWVFANEFDPLYVAAKRQFADTNKRFYEMPIYLDKASSEKVYSQSGEVFLGSEIEPIVISLHLFTPVSYFETVIHDKWFARLGILLFLYACSLIFMLAYYQYLNRQVRLSRSNHEYFTVFQRTKMPILLVNHEGFVTNCNSPALELVKCSQRTAKCQSVMTLLRLDKETNEALEQGIRQGQAMELSVRMVEFDNRERSININLVPISGRRNSKHASVALILYDITKEQTLRQQLEQANTSLEAKVAERTEELDVARKEAELANEAKSLFVANMSHELRTPMNGVFGMLNLIKKEPLSEQQNHYLQLAQASATNLTGLINSVLDISKIEAGKMELEVQSVNLEVVLSELLQSNSIRPKEKGLMLLLDSSGLTQPNFLGDVTRIRQIFTNLIGNAIKFTHNGYVLVCVKSKKDGADCRIDFVVEDSGVGIEPDKIDGLFNAFTQADNSITRKYGGTGLGLAITKQLVMLMGGEIHVESELGKGSRFVGHIMLRSAKSRAVTAKPLAGSCAVIIDEVAIRKQVLTNHLRQWGAEVIDADWHDVDQLAASGDFHQLLLFVDATKQGREVQAHLHTLLHAQHSEKLKVIVNCSQYQMNTAFAEQYDNVECLSPPISAVVLAHILFSAEGAEQPLCDSPPVTALDFHSVSGAKVLVVDDNAINQVVVTGVFKDLPITLVSCGDGKQALDILNADPHFDVILMDCQMPVMDGYSASLAIRRGDAGEQYTGIAIVAMTANAMAGDRERCLQAGMSDYITKPVDADQLLEKVYYWLSVANVKKRTQIDVKSEK
ncbi:hypothetical protein CWC31_13040 [Pseudoalteromonas ruthenica]|uniref:ATP-binding protein n=1 Tax=Pseudoalteromonas ruthenica TaxID=151081 RepID=UPI001109E34C|nr:ATP-binding protein [Pseudoalteromonas ruthenica]TLX50215.1 hypothetical protein CWC31_13040 [Pseudoalteromonas ruthenica]